MIGAIIVAAGEGTRMGSSKNKQYLFIGDRPLIAHTLGVFSSIDLIDNIVLVVREQEMDYCRKNIIEQYGIKNIMALIPGGSERQHSMLKGLDALKGICDIVVTHDGARPLVTPEIILESISKAYTYGASACAVPVKDTIKIVDSHNYIVDTPNRSKLYRVQTPQTFKFDILYDAHKKALEEGFVGTDDTVLLERIGVKVKLFEGSYENIKVTTPEDIYIAEAILNYRSSRKE